MIRRLRLTFAILLLPALLLPALLLPSVAAAQYENRPHPVKDLRAIYKYGEFTRYVGSRDFSVFLDRPEKQEELQDITGPYYDRVLAGLHNPQPIGFQDRYFVLLSLAQTPEQEDVMIAINWGGAYPEVALRRGGWVRVFSIGGRYSDLPEPLKYFVQEALRPELSQKVPPGAAFNWLRPDAPANARANPQPQQGKKR